MKILDPDGNEVPERDLWIYNRWRKQAAIEAAQSLQTIGEIDSSVGEMMRDLRDGAEFLQGVRPGVNPFDEHVSGLGWDPIKANDIADVYEWAVEREGWPSEANYAKMKLIYDSVVEEDKPSKSFVTSAATGASYSTLRKDLIKAGLIAAQPWTYLVFSPEVLGPGSSDMDWSDGGVGSSLPVFIRTRKEDELIAEATKRGLAALKINAFKGRLKFKRGKDGGLFDTQTGEAIELLTLEEWLGA